MLLLVSIRTPDYGAEETGMYKGYEDKQLACYQYICPNYMKCANALGKGCMVEEVPDEGYELTEEDCGEKNGYPLFRAAH